MSCKDTRRLRKYWSKSADRHEERRSRPARAAHGEHEPWDPQTGRRWRSIYTIALIGAAPDNGSDPALPRAYADVAREVLNPAQSSFSHGIRAYYFALAAAWLFGPGPFVAGTLAAFFVLIYRKSNSRSAKGVRGARALLEG